jgi:hypothetical protein
MNITNTESEHNDTALRGEMKAFRQALQGVKDRGTLKAWEVTALQTAADAHLELIHVHHTNEDNIFGPEFEKRFKFQHKVSGRDETSASLYYRARLDILASNLIPQRILVLLPRYCYYGTGTGG